MSEEGDQRFVRYLSHFLVSLGCVSISSRLIPPSKEQKFFTSGFILEVGGTWYFVTAGHVLNDIATYIRSWPDLEHKFVLYASFGTFTIRTGLLEFAYREPVFCEDLPSGLDFGAIRLTPSEQQTLRQIGVFPVEERYWDQPVPSQFRDFALLGLPLQNMDLETPREAGFQPVYLRVEPTTDLPETYVKMTDPMRFFKIMGPVDPGLDIEGMSGCPVFAFHKPDGSDDIKALVIAMQSSWFASRRVIATSDLRNAGELLRMKSVAVLPKGNPGA